MSYIDPVSENVEGVRQLVESPMNKTTGPNKQEGVAGDFEDVLDLDMKDEDLLLMARKWEGQYVTYEQKIKSRQEWNFKYYTGRQREGSSMEVDKVVASNLLFEAEETFIPAALAKNPEPVVFPASQNPEGVVLAKNVKTMLQYHADVLVLRRKLAMMVRHWSVDLIGAVKHAWDREVSDICLDIVQPQNMIFDPSGSIDVYGNFTGKYLGERKRCSAQELIDMFEDEANPQSSLTGEKKAYIVSTVDGMLGTDIDYTEWWTNEFCFYTYKGIVLDKHKNQYWNYETMEEDQYGEQTALPGKNHFGRPKMPYTFLSVFSFGKQPHDVTTLIEQNIPNQDLVNKRIDQIDKNLDVSNNSLAVSAENFNNETAKQAADAIADGRPVLIPRGKPISEAIQRLPANNFPADAYNQLQDMTQRTRAIFGTMGISSAGTEQEETVRGKIISSQQDSSRIGGGIGDSIEQVADNIFNWWLQLYYVFYDEPHYAAILGRGNALQYITLQQGDLTEKIIVSVAPNSMKPKDEITEQNLSIDLWNAHALDPLSLFERLNDPDPKETAARVVMWTTNPQQYAMTYFPESAPQQLPGQGAAAEENIPADTNVPLSESPPNPSLSQVPINNPGVPNI